MKVGFDEEIGVINFTDEKAMTEPLDDFYAFADFSAIRRDGLHDVSSFHLPPALSANSITSLAVWRANVQSPSRIVAVRSEGSQVWTG